MITPHNAKLVNRVIHHVQVAEGKAASTVNDYAIGWNEWAEYLGSVRLQDATAERMYDYLGQPGKGGLPLGPSTVKKRTMHLRTMYRVLCDDLELVPRNPARKLKYPSPPKGSPKPVPEATWLRFWNAELADDMRVACGLAFFCGLRRHEVTLLAPHHFVAVPSPWLAGIQRKGKANQQFPWHDTFTLHVQRRPDLTGAPDRFLGALRRLLEARGGEITLMPWRERYGFTADGRVIPPGWIQPDAFNKRLRNALEAVGMKRNAFTPHQMRHSFGTNMLRMGVELTDVSRLMGHESIQTTMLYLQDSAASKYLDAPTDTLVVPSRWGF